MRKLQIEQSMPTFRRALEQQNKKGRNPEKRETYLTAHILKYLTKVKSEEK